MVTRANQAEPWLNFEAGSLAKTVVDGNSARVVPLLLNMENLGQLDPGPLTNLQAEPATQAGVKKLAHSIGLTVGADRDAIDARFEAAWATFAKVLDEARAALAAGQPKAEPRDQADMLEELLALTRRSAVRAPIASTPIARPETGLFWGGEPADDIAGPDELFPLIVDALSTANVPPERVGWERMRNDSWAADVLTGGPLSNAFLRVKEALVSLNWPVRIELRFVMGRGLIHKIGLAP